MIKIFKSKKAQNTLVKEYAVILLLFLYLVGSVQIESFHALLHADEHEVLHTSQQESDPCHLKIYHQQRNGGCDHESHVVSTHKCPLCYGIFHTDQLTAVSESDKSVFFTIHQQAGNHPMMVRIASVHLPSRAPPVL